MFKKFLSRFGQRRRDGDVKIFLSESLPHVLKVDSLDKILVSKSAYVVFRYIVLARIILSVNRGKIIPFFYIVRSHGFSVMHSWFFVTLTKFYKVNSQSNLSLWSNEAWSLHLRGILRFWIARKHALPTKYASELSYIYTELTKGQTSKDAKAHVPLSMPDFLSLTAYADIDDEAVTAFTNRVNSFIATKGARFGSIDYFTFIMNALILYVGSHSKNDFI